MIRIVAASAVHIGPIANRMRVDDVTECEAFGHSPKQALRDGLSGSWFTLTACRNGRAEAMFGVTAVNAIEGVGRPWMLGTDAIYAHGHYLARHGRQVLDLMHKGFPRLENYVSSRNDRAIRLLRFWGFQIDAASVVVRGVEFLPFWRDIRV